MQCSGSKCPICSKVMSKYHIAQHLDRHTLAKRFQCKQKLPRGDVCERSYKQKSALVCHLREKHNIKSIESAKIKIVEGKRVGYETLGHYEVEVEEMELRWEQVNSLVEKYGEVIVE